MMRKVCQLVLLLSLCLSWQWSCRRIVKKPPASEIAADASDASIPLPEYNGPKVTLKPTILLISLDGFRWDYTDRVSTPHFDQLRKGGVQAKGLIPVFPSKTFPNHYSIVTGLYAEHHGIVSNSMFDPDFNALFSMTDPAAVTDGRWWGGEPIWVTAVKQGQRSATLFWPGSEAEIKGTRPTYWEPFSSRMSHDARLEQLFAWLTLPDDKRPTLLTLYLSDTDSAGHDHGPSSWQVDEAITTLDTTLGKLMAGLKARGLLSQINLMIVSDHGMTELSSDRRIYLNDYINLNDVYINDFSSVLGINPKEGKADLVYESLKDRHPHLQIYKRGELPARLHYNDHRRIPLIMGVLSPGWVMERERGTPMKYQGTHGYDPSSKDMHGFFLAHGPAFRQGITIDAFENVHLYELMCRILSLTPAPNDGKLDVTKQILRQ